MIGAAVSLVVRVALAVGLGVLTSCASTGETTKGGSHPCVVSGCSRQVCAEQEVMTTCEWRDEYACYRTARCERQADGKCGWTPTGELKRCLASPPRR